MTCKLRQLKHIIYKFIHSYSSNSLCLYKNGNNWRISDRINKSNPDIKITQSIHGPRVEPLGTFQDKIRCQQLFCGCHINPFIWISHELRAIYFEIPKVASSSIKSVFNVKSTPSIFHFTNYLINIIQVRDNFMIEIDNISRDDYRMIKQGVNVLQKKDLKGLKGYYSANTSEFIPCYLAPEQAAQKYSSYFKFAFVRNPWKRMVSNYLMFKRWPRKKIRRKGNFKKIRNEYSFIDFIKEAKRNRNHHWEQQVKFLPIKNGDVDLDFLGKLEKIDEGWKKIKSKLRVDHNLPSRNKTKHEKDYLSYYDDNSLQKINKVYKDDIQNLDYQEPSLT